MALEGTPPLSIKGAAGSDTRNIAQEVDGNNIGTKSLLTLGNSAGFTPPFSILSFLGYSRYTGVTSVSPTSYVFPYTGDTVQFDVSSIVSWTASTGQSWLHLTDETGTGNGHFHITSAGNYNTYAMSGLTTITSSDPPTYVDITIDAFYTVEPPSLYWAWNETDERTAYVFSEYWAGGTSNKRTNILVSYIPTGFVLTDGAGATLAVGLPLDWNDDYNGTVKITPPGMGANGDIIFTDPVGCTKNITVTKASYVPPATIGVTILDGGGDINFEIYQNNGGTCVIDSDVIWFTVGINYYGATTGETILFHYNITHNGDSAGSGDVGLTSSVVTGYTVTMNSPYVGNSGDTIVVTINDTVYSLTLSPTEWLGINKDGDNNTIWVTASSGNTWVVTTGQTWLHFDPPVTEIPQYFQLYCDPNPVGEGIRSDANGVIVTSHSETKYVSISQFANYYTLSLNPSSYSFGVSGDTIQVDVITDAGNSWEASDILGWTFLTDPTGIGSGHFHITCASNNYNSDARGGTISVTSSADTSDFIIGQYAFYATPDTVTWSWNESDERIFYVYSKYWEGGSDYNITVTTIPTGFTLANLSGPLVEGYLLNYNDDNTGTVKITPTGGPGIWGDILFTDNFGNQLLVYVVRNPEQIVWASITNDTGDVEYNFSGTAKGHVGSTQLQFDTVSQYPISSPVDGDLAMTISVQLNSDTPQIWNPMWHTTTEGAMETTYCTMNNPVNSMSDTITVSITGVSPSW